MGQLKNLDQAGEKCVQEFNKVRGQSPVTVNSIKV